jgi:hypothetical protein
MHYIKVWDVFSFSSPAHNGSVTKVYSQFSFRKATMSDTAGTSDSSYMRDTKNERNVKSSITTPVVITSYRALIACNGTSLSLDHNQLSSRIMLTSPGNLELGPREKKLLPDEDAWSTILNMDELDEGKETDKNWELAVSHKCLKKRTKKQRLRLE